MAKEFFRAWRPNKATLAVVKQCIAVTEDYMQQGYVLTLRQLYYQLVAQDLIPNTENSYRKISQYCTRARLAGMMDWSAIEDRARQPHKHPEWDNLSELAESALYAYRLPRWADQEEYAELWVEKDALASVLKPLANEYHVTLMVNRGYSSASAMKASADRIQEAANDRPTTIYYLGDLDPSGEDMVRDIDTRLEEFGVDVFVHKLALTMEQVEEHEPPPNYAKLTDPRAEAFIERYGNNSWEVDALPPAVLSELIRDAFGGIVDAELMSAVVAQEEQDKTRLREAVADIMGEA
jgi:hypothetical protein